MARKTSLREFQQRVAERLRDAQAQQATTSKLGFQAGGVSWLVNLDHVSEVIPVPTMTRVPLSRRWFLGVANVRGNLFSISDFSAFLGADMALAGTDRRAILLADHLIAGTGMLVTRMLGLRNPGQFRRTGGADANKPWIAGTLEDERGVTWHELDVLQLVHHHTFVDVQEATL